MKISTRHGIAFLCTPKCASTSIEAAITDLCDIHFSGHQKLKHISAQIYTEKIRPIHQHLFPNTHIESFCLIRNPLEWLQSWYRYRSRPALKNPNHHNHRNYTGNISYNKFVESYMTSGTRPPYARIKTQYDFMRLANGEIGVDHIFPMDRMDLLLDFIQTKTGQKIELSQLNRSRKNTPIPALDKKLEEYLRDYLANDIALYAVVKKYGRFCKQQHAKEFSPV